ncbi:MAG: phosphopantothenoylcysteine decarboxylase [bacterium]|nr:phosphopantothenoylcysteine decarboxylase [bacterium]
MKNFLKGKKILVSAGSTWVAIDRVRVMTSIFTGRTGLAIAEYACQQGADVTLLMGYGSVFPDKKLKDKVRVINFKYFDELYDLIEKEVTSKKYDVLIHSAAVSDYKPEKITDGKIGSGRKNLTIKLKPAIKIVDKVKAFDPSIFLVKFKLEVDKADKELIEIAYKSMLTSQADLIVANNLSVMEGKGNTYIIDPAKNIVKVKDRKNLPGDLLKLVNQNL